MYSSFEIQQEMLPTKVHMHRDLITATPPSPSGLFVIEIAPLTTHVTGVSTKVYGSENARGKNKVR